MTHPREQEEIEKLEAEFNLKYRTTPLLDKPYTARLLQRNDWDAQKTVEQLIREDLVKAQERQRERLQRLEARSLAPKPKKSTKRVERRIHPVTQGFTPNLSSHPVAFLCRNSQPAENSGEN